MEFLRERIGEILQQLKPLCYPVEKEIKDFKGQVGHVPLTDEVCVDTDGWERADPENLGQDQGAWFALEAEIKVPEEMAGFPVELAFSTGREGEWDAVNPQIAAYVRGKLCQGLDVNHRTLCLSEHAVSGEVIPVFLSVYTGEKGSVISWDCRLRAVDVRVREFYYDLLVPWQCLELMEEESREYAQLRDILNSAVNLLDMRRRGGPEFMESLVQARAELDERLKELPSSAVTVSCVGHTHIDVAWLWTLEVTREKAARSFATVLELMKRYPEYVFMSSQPQLYKFVKESQPGLYKQICERVKEGRWEPEGAMFLEADCNLTSGESLVRQCVYGKKFFRDEFGIESRILWLPDVFGYSAALPQIMEKCGIKSFMTTKISWNETNCIPYDTFWWEGIDGSRVLTHFITTRDYQKDGVRIATNSEFTTDFSTNYNGYIHPSQIKGAWQRYQQKGLNDNVLVSFGCGDGGGGPTAEMLETARRMKDGKLGCPAVRVETAGRFFDRLHERAGDTEFPVWSGELYLEYHRGTYTSMAEIKKANRRGEFALLNAETWSVLAGLLAGEAYPQNELAMGWELLMRNQFHDILPGSAIAEVYEDSFAEYKMLGEITGHVTDKALCALTERIGAQAGEIVVFNGNGVKTSGIVEIPRDDLLPKWITALEGKHVPEHETGIESELESGLCPVQWTKNGRMLFRAKDVPAKGWTVFRAAGSLPAEGSPAESAPAEAGENFICGNDKYTAVRDANSGKAFREIITPYYCVKWNGCGQITSLYDRRVHRELLKKGMCANVLMTYEDKPHKFDNWNIFEYYREKQWPVDQLVSMEVIEWGPVRMALELVWTYLDSQMKEIFYFYADSPRIDIHAEADWNENQLLLKALFPLELNAREAVYEIQYGHVKRSTTRNHSWEQARFEVCFQKWLDVSEYDYGVSFLSDCKYGVSIDENEVGLTLLKSGMYPNPSADRGHHEFTYSLFPHTGSWQEAGTVMEAYELNNPLKGMMRQGGLSGLERRSSSLPETYAPVQISGENIVLEVLKQAEDGKGVVLRLYECWNRRTKATLVFAQDFAEVYVCNMLEEKQELVSSGGRECAVEFKPFEILTLRVVFILSADKTPASIADDPQNIVTSEQFISS